MQTSTALPALFSHGSNHSPPGLGSYPCYLSDLLSIVVYLKVLCSPGRGCHRRCRHRLPAVGLVPGVPLAAVQPAPCSHRT